MQEQKRSKKGGDVKQAPPGFYLPSEARKLLDVTPAVFRAMVDRGELERVVPPMRSEGFYRITDVNKRANQNALFYLQNMATKEHIPVEFSRATEEDLQGIFDVVASLWGAENVTPANVHNTLYRANPYIDYVVKFRSLVLGYINATPYIPETLEAIMAGRKRGIDLTSRDVLPYESGKSYDVYVGIVVRQDIPHHEHYTERLIFGFFGALCDLATQQGITINHMYAISDQVRGISMSKKIGFEEQPPGSGRFILDMKTAKSILVRKYREVVEKIGTETYHRSISSKPISKRVTYDPKLGEVLQHLLETLNKNDATNRTQDDTLFLQLIDQLAESSQMTIEQQAVLRSACEILETRNTQSAKKTID